MFYTAYFDASGKVADPVMTVAGSVASVRKWSRFESQWGHALANEGIKVFHATDFAACKREFKNWRGDKARRSSFMATLGKIIRNSTNRFFIASVELNAWQVVNEEYLLEEAFHHPYSLCGFSVVLQVEKWRKGKGIRSPIEYVFEPGDEGWDGLRRLCSTSGIEPIRKKAVPCQVADWIAWKNRIACTNSLAKLNAIAPVSDVLLDIENFLGIADEIKSLDKMLVRPGRSLVYSPDALRRTCIKSRVPKRQKIQSVVL